MAILIYGGYWIGSRVDKWLQMEFPAFTIVFLFLFLGISFYTLIKGLPKNE